MTHPCAEGFRRPGVPEDAEIHCRGAGGTMPDTGPAFRGRNFLDLEGAVDPCHRVADLGEVRGLILEKNPLKICMQLPLARGLQPSLRDMGHQHGRGILVEMHERFEAENGAQKAVILARPRIAHLRCQLDPGEQAALNDDMVMIAGAVAMAHHDPGHGCRRQAAQVQIGRQDAAGHVVIGIASRRQRTREVQVVRIARQCFEEPARGGERARRKRAGDQVHAGAAHISLRGSR